MRNVLKLITQEERAGCQVHLESPEFQGNLMQCFHLTVNQLQTRSEQETEATNPETSPRVQFLDLLTHQMLGISSRR